MSSSLSLRAALNPAQVRTNQSSGLIKLIACVCMACDHFGKMLFPQYPVLRLIGRTAFPLFAYGVATGSVYTRDPVKYLTRVVLLALVCQPLYAVALAHETAAMYAVPFSQNPLLAAYSFYFGSWQRPSILVSLSLTLAILLCLKKEKYILALGVYALCVRFSGNLDYGVHGVELALIFYLLCGHPLLCAAGAGGFFLWWAHQGSGYPFFGVQFSWSIYALPAVLFACLPLRWRWRAPKWLSYGFYPAHLIVLALLVKLGVH